MARVERIINVCDGCGAEDGDGNGPVETHTLAVDGARWTIDSCAFCWRKHFRDLLKPLLAVAVTASTRRRKSPTRRRTLQAV